MSEIINIPCPYCGKNTRVLPGDGADKCEHCWEMFSIRAAISKHDRENPTHEQKVAANAAEQLDRSNDRITKSIATLRRSERGRGVCADLKRFLNGGDVAGLDSANSFALKTIMAEYLEGRRMFVEEL